MARTTTRVNFKQNDIYYSVEYGTPIGQVTFELKDTTIEITIEDDIHYFTFKSFPINQPLQAVKYVNKLINDQYKEFISKQ